MRVVIVTESFLPTVNGVTGSVCRLLDYLAANGHDAIVIAPDAGTLDHYGPFDVRTVPAIAYRQFPVGIPHPLVAKIITEFAPDVIHAASPFLLGAQALAAAKRAGIPSVAIYQTDIAGYATRNKLGPATKFAWKLVRWVHEHASLTLVPSRSSYTDLANAGVTNLDNWARGVDSELFHPRWKTDPRTQALRKRLAPEGELIVGYVGRLAPEKQVERLADLRGIPGIQVAVVGDGPSEASVRSTLHRMPATLLGRLDKEELAIAYASFDLFVHTGCEETFGQTIQEAHATGLPVVAPRAGGPIDLISDGFDGLLYDPDSRKDLRDCVEDLLSSPTLRVRMGEAGRRKVHNKSWDALFVELTAHYTRVITEQSQRRILI